ncbi:MAG: phosphorylase [Cyanobacteria bacterium J06626_18]
MNPPSSDLWPQIVNTTQQALESGALQPIATQLQFIPDAKLKFCVRILDNLTRKEAAKKSRQSAPTNKPFNPFFPYEEALFVANLSATHVCLLNKYNVVDHHILMVTREYESQDAWLTQADFEAFTQCLTQIDGLGFYNGGTMAGASQHHKHLQLVPFTSEIGSQELPLSELIDIERKRLETASQLPSLPFQHGIQSLTIQWTASTLAANSQQLLQLYKDLLVDVGLNLEAAKPDVPYNLLLTREWMMVVPRSQESYADIGVNSLGYSGWLLVKTHEDLERLKSIGPMTLLQTVGKRI